MIYIAYLWLIICILSMFIIIIHIIKHPQHMKIMNYVWPINALWGGPFILWAYFTLGIHRHMHHMKNMANMSGNQNNMDHNDMNHKNSANKYQHFWQGIIVDALHCGAGCSLADLIGSFIFFYLIPFTIAGQSIFGEWLFDYILALIIGVFFQYKAIKPMSNTSNITTWVRAFKIDFWSLTSWQIGMYGWSAVEHFIMHLNLMPANPIFWLMMSIGMMCGFITAYPTNWLLVKLNIKTGM